MARRVSSGGRFPYSNGRDSELVIDRQCLAEPRLILDPVPFQKRPPARNERQRRLAAGLSHAGAIAERLAGDLMVQEVGHARLRERGIDLIAADNPSSFLDDTPTVRQVLGAIAEFDKAMTVAKLRGARERKRAAVGKCEGRKGHLEVRPDVVREAKRLRRRSPKTGRQRSLREVAAELAALGHLNTNRRPFSASSVKAMIEA